MIDDRYIITAALNVIDSQGLNDINDFMSTEKLFNYRLDVIKESIRLYLIDNPDVNSFETRFGYGIYSVVFFKEDREIRVTQKPISEVLDMVVKELDGNKIIFDVRK